VPLATNQPSHADDDHGTIGDAELWAQPGRRQAVECGGVEPVVDGPAAARVDATGLDHVALYVVGGVNDPSVEPRKTGVQGGDDRVPQLLLVVVLRRHDCAAAGEACGHRTEDVGLEEVGVDHVGADSATARHQAHQTPESTEGLVEAERQGLDAEVHQLRSQGAVALEIGDLHTVAASHEAPAQRQQVVLGAAHVDGGDDLEKAEMASGGC